MTTATTMNAVEVLEKMLENYRRKGPAKDDSNAPKTTNDVVSWATFIAALERDLEGEDRVGVLRGLCDLLCNASTDDRAAATEVLNEASWNILGPILGVIEQSPAAASSSFSKASYGSGSPSSRSHNDHNLHRSDDGMPTTDTKQAEEAVLSERLVLEFTEMFSPKELHIMALEHLHAYSGERALRVVLAVLRRSTQRMSPLQRAKFHESAMQPAFKATKRVAASVEKADGGTLPATDDAAHDGASSGDDEECNNALGGVTNNATADGGMVVDEDGLLPPRAALLAAVTAAEASIEFIGPLLEQECEERRLEAREAASATAALAAAAAGQEPAEVMLGERARKMAASDLSVAAYIGFALSALAHAAETSVCAAATTAATTGAGAGASAGAGAGSSTLKGWDCEAPAMSLARAEERLVELVVDSPVVDLQFILVHGCRLAYADRAKRRRGEGEEWMSRSSSLRAPSRFGDLAVAGAMPWPLRGVSPLAYLVACVPSVRDRWLPLVWSRQTERWLFLPHAESLMRDKSKRIAARGLELACFVAERFERFPDEAIDAFAFEWEPRDESAGGEPRGGGDGDVGKQQTTNGDATRKGKKSGRQQQWWFDPCYRFDLAGYLQVLLDVMVSCPLSNLRARGHAALCSFLAGTAEESRFHVLKHLINRCPWPNATGLLLDAFRREIDRALRRAKHGSSSATALVSDSIAGDGSGGSGGGLSRGEKGRVDSSTSAEKQDWVQSSRSAGRGSAAMEDEGDGEGEGGSTGVHAGEAACSPFASAPAGDVVCEQLRRACRGGPPTSLLMDMDSRTGGLTLARYAYALDGARGDGDGEGRLKLREPRRLQKNRQLVQGFLDELRRANATANSAGPDYFRLFILEDAAQQCLQELLL